jgi:flavin-dependent dehydrogenase
VNIDADVVIAGGGLAGLGLAKQIKSRRPETVIVVLEKQGFPRPRAIAKVGESTVEIGSHYLGHTLGLHEHLQRDHLLKFGLRIFLGAPANDFSEQDELGPSETFGIPTYQIDRGDLENHLHDMVQELGVEIIDRADISELIMGDKHHRCKVTRDNQHYHLRCRWFLDAAGRASLLKNTFNLNAKNDHKANAVWFRIDRRIEIDDWSQSKTWRQRSKPEGTRWLSTNHLSGPGYWVWIIPLASGVTSIGVVMDDKTLQDSGIQCQDSAVKWLQQHEARCADAIAGAQFLDFVILRDYSYSCKKLFSDKGWAITGEAGYFTDPFYSPGSDFIAMGNDFIKEFVCDDLNGEDIRFKTAFFELIFKSIYENTLSLYTNQYGGFGDRRMMSLKLVWDQSYYWGILALLFFQNALADIYMIRTINPLLQKTQALNKEVQAHFRARAQKRLVLPSRGSFINQFGIPCLKFFNSQLKQGKLETDELIKSLHTNADKLEQIAKCVINLLSDQPSSKAIDNEQELLGDYRSVIMA